MRKTLTQKDVYGIVIKRARKAGIYDFNVEIDCAVNLLTGISVQYRDAYEGKGHRTHIRHDQIDKPFGVEFARQIGLLQ